MTDDRRALVLGGGGVTGVAWEVGMIHGLAGEGVDLTDADLFVGTSAGSVVAAQIAGGKKPADMYATELADTSGDRNARIGTAVVLQFAAAMLWPGHPQRGRARLGRAALRARTVPESARREAIMTRVTAEEWPPAQLRVTAVEAETGKFVVFGNDSGVPLVDAVAASCAVPIVWPPMTVAGKRYIDGGVRSLANVDIAKGYDRVVVIAPALGYVRRSRADVQARRLGPAVRSAVVSPSDAALTAIGRNPLDPDHRADAAEAGHRQATEVADRVRAVWM